MRTVLVLALLFACGKSESPPPAATAPAAPRSAPPADAAPPPIDAAPVPDAATASASKDVALASLDAMLAEIDTHWKKAKDLHTPSGAPGFRVTEDNGVPVLIPEIEIPIAEVAARLKKRPKVKNPGLKMYTDGSLVAVDPSGAAASNEPIVLALNETLIIFLTASPKDPKRLGRIDVAMP